MSQFHYAPPTLTILNASAKTPHFAELHFAFVLTGTRPGTACPPMRARLGNHV